MSKSRKPSLFEQALSFLFGWAIAYAVYRYAFHVPYAGAVSYFAASVAIQLHYIGKAVGSR